MMAAEGALEFLGEPDFHLRRRAGHGAAHLRVGVIQEGVGLRERGRGEKKDKGEECILDFHGSIFYWEGVG
jgi:hypothetical protein